jgi:hypothetical protein
MKRVGLWLLTCLCTSVCFAEPAGDPLTFRESGFTIAALDVVPGNAAYTPLLMSLPASDGFAPNVNVQVEPYPGKVNQYIALSRKQFAAAGLNVIRETRSRRGGWVVEYRGSMQGRALHWYARAESRDKRVYLITATATEGQWSSVSKRLKASVDSFSLVGG